MSDSSSKMAYQKTLRKLFGNNDEKKVFIISGSPGSGKSYYAEKHKGENDIVFDMDKICSAIDGKNVHDDHSNILDIVLNLRNTIFEDIAARKGAWGNAFIISSSPDDKYISDLSNRLDAEIIKMPANLDKCINNLSNDPTRAKTLERDIKLAQSWHTKQGQEVISY
ncbi:hypothetical protein FFK04_07520 [Ruminococcus sp. KGMB03662]|nr:hypothetical protein FFK04_07520 [Ruminococcus sp. KGMB03662]